MSFPARRVLTSMAYEQTDIRQVLQGTRNNPRQLARQTLAKSDSDTKAAIRVRTLPSRNARLHRQTLMSSPAHGRENISSKLEIGDEDADIKR